MISTDELVDWMKADDADAYMLRILEQAAVKAIEKLTGRYLGVTAARTETIRFVGWPLVLSNEPIGGVLTSLETWDGSAFQVQTLTDYSVEGSFVWPNSTTVSAEQTATRRVKVIYQAGYTVDPLDADVWDAPEDIKQAVRLLVGHWFENRESVVVGTSASEIPMTVQMLVGPHARVSV